MTDIELIVEALDCAGVLEAAGGADAVAALVEDGRPSGRPWSGDGRPWGP